MVQHFWQQVHCDIFFIDWERPRVFEHHISLRTVMGGMDTPSITSSVSVHLNSLKQMTLDRHNFCIFLQSKNYPQNDGVSAWRTYFVANEWVKLSTARKCSMFIQMVSVSAIILVSCPAIASSFESDSNRFRVRFFFLPNQVARSSTCRRRRHAKCEPRTRSSASRRFNCLLGMLRGATPLPSHHPTVVHQKHHATIHRHLFDVQYFGVYILPEIVWILHSRPV